MVCEFESCIGLCTDGVEIAWDSLSPPFSLCPSPIYIIKFYCERERAGQGEQREKEEREKETESSVGSRLSKEPDMGLDPMTLGSHPEPKSRVTHLTESPRSPEISTQNKLNI